MLCAPRPPPPAPVSSQPAPDLDPFWMPFTANREFKRAPRLFRAAEGVHYTTVDGRRVLDGTAGLWCVNAGHGREAIADAIARQVRELDFAPTFQLGHPLAFELAGRLAELAGGGLDRVFFTNSGSEGVDTALKIALAYHAARGEPGRTRLVGRERAYHGVNLGGTSVGGIAPNRAAFGPLLPGVLHLPHTHDLEQNRFTRGQPPHGAGRADALEAMIDEHGAESIAAVIVEPVAGSTGVLPPPVGYLERLRELCDRHGVLLIFDEVITGFGRLGTPFAVQRFGVEPDLLVCAKGLTNGTVPMGAVLCRRAVHDAVVEGAAAGIELFHGYTYSGHPVASAAALATLDLYRDEALFERAAAHEGLLADAIHALEGAPHVIDVRSIGLVAAVELEPVPGEPTRRAREVFARCFDAGLLVRTTGDTIALSPPLSIAPGEIEELGAILGEALAAG
jgi:beta-alanine--pyruvate transaminase